MTARLDSPTLRLADSAMLASTMFACLFASYTLLALLFQIWLFRALDLGWTFPTDQSEDSTLRDIYTQAQTRELREVYWCWWGHREAPIGHIFWLLSMIGGLVGVSGLVRRFCSADRTETIVVASVWGHRPVLSKAARLPTIVGVTVFRFVQAVCLQPCPV